MKHSIKRRILKFEILELLFNLEHLDSVLNKLNKLYSSFSFFFPPTPFWQVSVNLRCRCLLSTRMTLNSSLNILSRTLQEKQDGPSWVSTEHKHPKHHQSSCQPLKHYTVFIYTLHSHRECSNLRHSRSTPEHRLGVTAHTLKPNT